MTGRAETLPQIFLATAGRLGEAVALRVKRLGIWEEITWGEYLKAVRAVAGGLVALGVGRGDRVAILSENRPEWLYADLATQSLGAISVGIYAESTPAEVLAALRLSGAKVIVIEDQEQADKLLAVREHLGHLERAVVIDREGMRGYDDPFLLDWGELLRQGEAWAADPAAFEERVAATRADDPAAMAFTSGTTGQPKGALLSHRNIIAVAESVADVDPPRSEDEVLSYLPFPWVGEKIFSLFFALRYHYRVNFPEDMEMQVVLQNLREVFPSILFCPPRIWDNLCSYVLIRMENASRLQRALYRHFLEVGGRVVDLRIAGRPVPWPLRIWRAVGEVLIARPIKNNLGLTFLRTAYTGGGAIGPEVYRFWHALGIPLRNVYGQTEATLVTMQRPGEIDARTAGRPLPGVEVRIGDGDEILVRSRAVFLGYHANPEATAETIRGGWLHTGDKGYLTPDGELVVIDRRKDVIRTATGAEFSPQLLENSLRFSPYIKEAVVIGQDRPFVTAIIQIDYGYTGQWAQRRGIPYTTFADLARKEEVRRLVEAEVERVNARLPEEVRIRRFHLLERELDPDDQEITRTSKVRRGLVLERFARELAALYGEGGADPGSGGALLPGGALRQEGA